MGGGLAAVAKLDDAELLGTVVLGLLIPVLLTRPAWLAPGRGPLSEPYRRGFETFYSVVAIAGLFFAYLAFKEVLGDQLTLSSAASGALGAASLLLIFVAGCAHLVALWDADMSLTRRSVVSFVVVAAALLAGATYGTNALAPDDRWSLGQLILALGVVALILLALKLRGAATPAAQDQTGQGPGQGRVAGADETADTQSPARLRSRSRVQAVREKLAPAVLHRLEWWILALAALAGLGAGLTAALTGDPASAPVDFFATASQVFPVFLVALAVEQRLADRLGVSEEGYVRMAEQALADGGNAVIAWEGGDEAEATRLQKRSISNRDTRWVEAFVTQAMEGQREDQPDIDGMARTIYGRRRRGELTLVGVVVVLLLVGESCALVGLAQDGGESAVFVITMATLAVTFVAITLAAFRDLLPTRP